MALGCQRDANHILSLSRQRDASIALPVTLVQAFLVTAPVSMETPVEPIAHVMDHWCYIGASSMLC